MVMRRKWMAHYPAPDYEKRGKEYWYTLKLKHGGMIVKDVGGLAWIEGTLSAFDCVDSRKLDLRYIESLAEQLGYMGKKKFYGVMEGAGLKNVESEHDIWMVLQSSKGREFTLFLEGNKTIVPDEDEDHVGEIEWVEPDDNVESLVDNLRVSLSTKAVVKSKQGHKAKETVPREQNLEDEGHCKEIIMVDVEEIDDSTDEEFVGKEDSCDELLDDIIFHESVDLDAEWAGPNTAKQVEDQETSESDGAGDDDHSNESDFESVGTDSDAEQRKDVIVFRASTALDPEFRLQQIFCNKTLFKTAVNSYSVKAGHPTRFTKNDARRIYARCKSEGCNWHINALKVKNEESFQIREMDLKHTCPRQHVVDNANSRWLAERYEKAFRADPTRSVRGWRRETTEELGVYISPFQAYRAKKKALKLIEGDSTEQYAKLWDYADALRLKNPGSTVKLEVDTTPQGNKFKRLYICLFALKIGFKSGCRPWIGVDGCHLRGPTPGVLLTAVCMDPNNDPYPLAYAVVGVENGVNWEWFLELLKDDLMEEREDAYAIMSDKQKGLINAFEKVMPAVENRFCVRHLHGNMKRQGYRGNEFKRLLWKAAKATTVQAFNRAMAQMGDLDARCVEWLKDKHPSQWSRSHFNTFGKCDTLVNNMCEQWNAALLDAREKSILTMLEWIREYCMGRLQKNRDRAERRWEGQLICPRIRKILNKVMEDAADCIPMKSNEFCFEVSSSDGSRYAVDLLDKSCDCRKWNVSGIPCKHAVSAINAAERNPEEFVHSCYSVETYSTVYAHAIAPMNGEELWDKTGYIPPLPPDFGGKKKGRPKKARRFDASVEEGKGKQKMKGSLQKMSKQSFTVKCKYCGEAGHNKLGCTLRKVQRETAANAFPGSTSSVAANVEAAKNSPHMDDPICDKAVQEVMDVLEEFPPLTQEEEAAVEEIERAAAQEANNPKPTTRAGRKRLARKRAELSKVGGTQNLDGTVANQEPYSVATALECPLPKKRGVNIRIPPPMSFQPNSFLGNTNTSMVNEREKEKEKLKVINMGGKKFVTLSSLKSVTQQGSKGKEKA